MPLIGSEFEKPEGPKDPDKREISVKDIEKGLNQETARILKEIFNLPPEQREKTLEQLEINAKKVLDLLERFESSEK